MLLGNKPIGTVGYMGGLPCLLEKFCWCWGQMIQFNQEIMCLPGQYVHYIKATHTDHGPARNSLVNEMLGDWIVMLDTDHEFPPDIIDRLLFSANEYKVDVLSGVYQFKAYPHMPVLFQWVKSQQNNDKVLQPMCNWSKDCNLLEIGSAGGGVLFIRRSVFDRIENKLKEQPFDRRLGLSEDHSFFWRCNKLGIKCFADMRLQANHLRVSPVTLDDYDPSDLPGMQQQMSVEGFK